MLLLGLALGGASCSKPFERTEELANYLTNVHGFKFEGKQYVAFLQNDFCGACTAESIDFLLSALQETEVPATIVLAAFKQDLFDRIRFNNPAVRILIDEGGMLPKYGLRYTSDLFFILEGDKVKYWSYIREDDFKKLGKALGGI